MDRNEFNHPEECYYRQEVGLAAGSVVSKNVKLETVVGGNPAKVLKKIA